ncbi:TIR domain-containing protein [Listeria seeligeri]|uniref:TIR domain-containing protein n=1 Tax=Listeria seeligeri TaxID=1640 RepID=UPI0022EBD1ED|nr:TIR domain-containing protein [Listeria seeligeri]
MAVPRAFISFDFDNNETEKRLFAGQAKNSRTPFSIQDWSSKSSLPQSQWEASIEEKIKKCNMVIVLVGRNISSAVGVRKEIDMASKNNVPVFGVYVDGANTLSAIPYNISRSRVIVWNWDKIASAVNEMMSQGKNR